jgi:hypothetical protein
MRSLPLLGALALMSCRVGDVFVPTPDNMVGAYTATQLLTADPSGIVNWLDAGGSLTLTLNADGKTSGHLFLPGGAPGGGDLDADMAGSWLLIGHTVLLGQAAETFVREMDFTADLDRLAGDKSFGALRVIIVLTK